MAASTSQVVQVRLVIGGKAQLLHTRVPVLFSTLGGAVPITIYSTNPKVFPNLTFLPNLRVGWP